MAYEIGLLIFPDITQLDMTGPYEVFIKFPDANVHLIWKSAIQLPLAAACRSCRPRLTPIARRSTLSACPVAPA